MTLPYDKTGTAPGNKIVDELQDTTSAVAIWPDEGAFFKKEFSITAIPVGTSDRVDLVVLKDYIFSPTFLSEAIYSKQEIYSFIIVLDPSLWTNIKITYIGLGRNDQVLIDEVEAKRPFNEFDIPTWLSFKGELHGARLPGSSPIISGGSYLEVFSTRMAEIVTALRSVPRTYLEDAIGRNTASNISQDLQLALLTANSNEKDVLITLINSLFTPDSAIMDAAAITNAAQDVLIGLNTTARDILEAAILSNTNKNAAQDLAIQSNNDIDVGQDNSIVTIDSTIDNKLIELAGLISTFTTNIAALNTSIVNQVSVVDTLELADVAQDTNIALNTSNIAAANILLDGIATAISARATAISATGDVLLTHDLPLNNNLAKNAAQDLLIAATKSDLDTMLAGVAAIDLTIQLGNINTNLLKDSSQDVLIAVNTATNAAQDLDLTTVEAALPGLQSGIVAVSTAVLDSEITAVDVVLVTISSKVTANSNKEIVQAARIVTLNSDIAGLVPTGIVDLTPYQAQVTANTTERLALKTAVDATVVKEGNQEISIALAEVKGTALMNEVLAFSDSALVSLVNGQVTSVSINDTKWRNVAIKDSVQDSAMGSLTASGVTIGNDLVTDITPLTNRVNAVTQAVIDQTALYNTAAGLEAVQVTDTNTNATDIAALVATGGGSIVDTTTIDADLTSNAGAITTNVTNAAAVNTAETAQNVSIENIRVRNLAQDARLDAIRAAIFCGARIISPEVDEVVKTLTPVLTSSAYEPPAAGDAITGIAWEIDTDILFSNPTEFTEWGSNPSLTWLVPSDLTDETLYYCRVRHYSSISGTPQWGAVTKFDISTPLIWSKDSVFLGDNYLKSDNGNAKFGESTAITTDGLRLVVGAKYDDTDGTYSGLIYTFDWNGTAWVQNPFILHNPEGGGRQIGRYMTISGNGLVLFSNDHTVYGITFDWNGSAWIYRGVGTRIVPGRTHHALSYDGSTLITGSEGSSVGIVYTWNWNGVAWIKDTVNYLTSPNGTNGYSFGAGISISGDDTVLAVGDPNGAGAGGVFIYDWNGSIWVLRGMVSTDGNVAGIPENGRTVTLNSDGTIVVFKGGNSTVHTFDWDGSIWGWRDPDLYVETGLPAGETAGITTDMSISGDGQVLIIGSGDYYVSALGGVIGGFIVYRA